MSLDGEGSDWALPRWHEYLEGLREQCAEAQRAELLDAHIERLWMQLSEQSRRRLGVIAISTITGVEPEDHALLIGALALIAQAEGVYDEEREFAETYLSVDWVCEAVAEYERAVVTPSATSLAERREQVRLAAGRHRAKKKAQQSSKDRKKAERREERMQDAASRRAIGVDGEGMSLPDGSHVYRYMAACLADGTVIAELEREGGIKTREALDFIAELPKFDDDGVPYLGVFGYGLGYDWTKWLEKVKNKPLFELFHSDDLEPKVTCGDLKLMLIGKCLEFNDGKQPKRQKQTKVWDVLKGFQSTFVKAIKAWKVGTPEEWERIEAMKKQRGNFVDSDWGGVQFYCKDECRLLAELVEVYVRAHVEAGIDLRGKYHGAGSTSDAFLMMMDALSKKSTRALECDELDGLLQMRSAFSRAFFGGRAEVSRLGVVKGPVWMADIASAYPHVLFELPCVKHGKWRKAKGRGLKRALRAAKVAVVHYSIPTPLEMIDEPDRQRADVSFSDQPDFDREKRAKRKAKKKKREAAAELAGEEHDEDDVPELARRAHERALMMGISGTVASAAWGPLPYRTKKGSIVFPTVHPGGWAWLSEFRACSEHFDGVKASEAWVLRGECQCERPYRDIGKYYMLRIQWDKESGDKDGSGKGKVLKLGYNGCYGKMAQVIGKNPKYACRVVAGHITGATRGRLFEAIMSASNPWNVFYAATDGLIATEKLAPPNPEENETTPQTKKWLGVWEISEPVKEDIFVVQPGFYFSLAEKGKARTRGTPLDIVYEYRSKILDQWRRDPTRKPRGLPKQSTFHGAKSSIRPPTLKDSKYRRDKLYGRWTQDPRRINYVVSPKRSSLVDQGDESYRLSTWALRPSEPESHEYKKDPTFQAADIVNDEQPDFVEPLVRGVGEVDDAGGTN